MMYYIAASAPAQIQVINANESSLFSGMANDISCGRWSAAFQKSKILQMPKEFQSQLYINAKFRLAPINSCSVPPSGSFPVNSSSPLPSPSPASSSGSSNQSGSGSSGGYTPSSSPIWGGVFK